jgi:hypothetical protein
MPLARASRGAAAGAARRGARRAVLDNDATLERILSCGGLRAADVASAALVCRAWCRVAASDAVWRPVWRREAPSLRALEPRIAQPAGAGFRAAVAQLRGSALLAREPAWTLDDFSVAVDITWRGRPLLSACRPLSALDYQDAEAAVRGEAVLALPNALQQDDTEAALCVRRLRKALETNSADGDADGGATAARRERAVRAALKSAAANLQLRLLFVRSDGAVACLLRGAPCTDAGAVYPGENDDDDDANGITVQPKWLNDVKDATPLLTVEDDMAATMGWALVLDSGLGARAGESGGGRLCRECALFLRCERADVDVEPPTHAELLFALTRVVRWVAPRAAVAQAADAAARHVAQRTRHRGEREAAAAAAAAARRQGAQPPPAAGAGAGGQ